MKQIKHARWIVIRQYWSLSGCLTIITLPPSECRWLEATSAWDGRRNHNNLTFDDDTLYFFSLHVYVLCLFLFRSFFFSKKIALGWNRRSIRLPDSCKPCFREKKSYFLSLLSAGSTSFLIVIYGGHHLDELTAFVLCFVVIHGQMKCLLKLMQDTSTCERPCSSTNCCHKHPEEWNYITKGVRSGKCVIRQFRRFANLMVCKSDVWLVDRAS